MLCVADGSDMQGSLRNPAGWSNIYSHRPTAGMMEEDETNDTNDDGEQLLPYPISTVGPMARSPLDVAKLLETMAGGPNKFDASSVGDSNDEAFSSTASMNFRIGWLGDWSGEYPFEPGILPFCRGSLDILTRDIYGTVEDFAAPPFSAKLLWKSWTTIRSKTILDSFQSSYDLDQILEDRRLKPEALWEIRHGLALTKDDLHEAVTIANEWSMRAIELLEWHDVLALPAAQVWPFPADWRWPKSICGTKMDSYHRWMEVVVPCSLAGLPCATIPAGFGENGLPMGIQLIGSRGSDSKLLRLAQLYHE
jgi:amidase